MRISSRSAILGLAAVAVAAVAQPVMGNPYRTGVILENRVAAQPGGSAFPQFALQSGGAGASCWSAGDLGRGSTAFAVAPGRTGALQETGPRSGWTCFAKRVQPLDLLVREAADTPWRAVTWAGSGNFALGWKRGVGPNMGVWSARMLVSGQAAPGVPLRTPGNHLACMTLSPGTTKGGVFTGQGRVVNVAVSRQGCESAELTVRKEGGSESGVVTSEPAALACGSGCEEDTAVVPAGATFRLLANPSNGYEFVEWGGACTGTDDDCLVQASGAPRVTATFRKVEPSLLRVSVEGNGLGTVSSDPPRIGCTSSNSCAAGFARGSLVRLTATPLMLSRFEGWAGACAGQGRVCVIDVSDGRETRALFTYPTAPGPTPGPTPGPAPGPTPAPVPGPGPIVPVAESTANPPAPDAGPEPGIRLTLTQLRVSRATVTPRRATTIAYRLNQDANVRITFTRKGQKKATYARVFRAGTKGGDAGLDRVQVAGRNRGRNVLPGKWVMTVTATNATGTAGPLRRTLTFRP